MDYLLNDTIEFLEKIGWHYRREGNTNLLALSLRGEKETYPMLIYAKAPFWICIAQLPWEIPGPQSSGSGRIFASRQLRLAAGQL